MKIVRIIIFALLFSTACNGPKKKQIAVEELQAPVVVERVLVDSVWAANGVGFAMQTLDNMQFVAYFDSERMMTVASRQLEDSLWVKKTLDNQLMWDSHNRVDLAIDKEGYIHVSGNMHVHPLAYYRSSKPYDVKSMYATHQMVNRNEQRVTYPSFYFDKHNDLFFSYRCGSCGNGDIIVNRLDAKTQEWERFLEEPLFAGVAINEDRAAYHKIIKDSNGMLHYLWMWRWTPKVETSHNLCYAKTYDMKQWFNAAGDTLSLPFRPDDAEVAVDPVPSKGGLHNSRFKFILTKKNEPVIAYVKYDESGYTQLYLAKFMQEEWKIKQLSDWHFRWQFIDGGAHMSKGAVFQLTGISDDELLAIDWSTEENKSGRYVVDLTSLSLSSKDIVVPQKWPDSIEASMTGIDGMNIFLKENILPDGRRYVLKWEALHGGFRQHAPDVIPTSPLSPLVVLKIED